MTASHFIAGRYNGQEHHWIDHFPTPVKPPGAERPVIAVEQRYELTEAQARLSVDELKALCAAGMLKRWEPTQGVTA